MAEKHSMIAPGGMIGILGGGQLGRMLSMAAAELGYRSHVFEPEAEAPAGDVCARLTTAYYTDEIALASFARDVDVITYEFENVPVETVEMLNDIKPVRPGVKALSIAQDRLLEKQFAANLNVQTAPFAAVDNQGDLDAAITKIGLPAILKTRRMGYDGKGQVAIRTAGDIAGALNAIGGDAAILEGFIAFDCEVSVIAARSSKGEIKCYPPAENEHKNHILDVTRLPATISREVEEKALNIARKFLDALDYVGVLAVEMFITGTGEVLVNEIAPRVHNSGHWSIEGAPASQFEQHIRAICGLPLGDPTPYGQVEMKNLIGDDAADWAKILADPSANLHLYGKKETRPGRKMGHVTKLTPAQPTS